MKHAILILGLAACLALAGDTPTAQPGRWQLMQGRYDHLANVAGKTSQSSSETVFKIDTVTGATWRLTSLQIEDRIRIGWIKCDDMPDRPFSPTSKTTTDPQNISK